MNRELAVELTPELSTELTPELIPELTPELTPKLNTELATALNHEMDPEIEISEPYETAANDDHSSSFTTTVLKLGGYVEWLDPTVGGERLIMSHASIWWGWHGWSGDAALRYAPYLRDGSVTGRTRGSILHLMISFGSSLIFMQWLRIEVIVSVIISVIIWGLSVVNRHGVKMTGPATSKQCGEDGIRPRGSKMSLIDDGYPE
jgi:hypothetical protein